MDYENFEARVLEPIRKKLDLAKLNFQVLRRSFATLAYGDRKGYSRTFRNSFGTQARILPSKITSRRFPTRFI